MEALKAAKAIVAARSAVRGGPWVLPTLTARDWRECLAVARCSTLKQLFEEAEQLGEGSLASHMAGSKFEP